MFERDPPKEIWEQTDDRFSPDMFKCSMINLDRVATFMICKNSFGKCQY